MIKGIFQEDYLRELCRKNERGETPTSQKLVIILSQT